VKIQFLGAHNCETATTGMMCLLVDERIVLDAGALTRHLSLSAQFKLEAVLLTHGHYDHFRDVPMLGMNLFLSGRSIDVYGSQNTRDVLAAHVLDGSVYSRFFEHPEGNPTLRYHVVEADASFKLGDYEVLPVALPHPVPVLGYQMTDAAGKRFFYSGDTGIGLSRQFQAIRPDFMAIEVTAANKYTEFFSSRNQHLTPETLGQELKNFRRLKGYLPPVACVHMSPHGEAEIAAEIESLAAELGSPVYLAKEGMTVTI
jgi:hypothetical protein